MTDHGVIHRTHLIHAAATNKCNSTIIKMKRPDWEERNKSLPHWMRRQIGAVVPWNKLDRKMVSTSTPSLIVLMYVEFQTGGWVAEFVRCVNGDEILRDWAQALNEKAKADFKKSHNEDAPIEIKKVRPHVLKVDVEGHDYEVCSAGCSIWFDNDRVGVDGIPEG